MAAFTLSGYEDRTVGSHIAIPGTKQRRIAAAIMSAAKGLTPRMMSPSGMSGAMFDDKDVEAHRWMDQPQLAMTIVMTTPNQIRSSPTPAVAG